MTWVHKALNIGAAFGITYAVLDKIVHVYPVPGPSMSPTLSPESWETGKRDHVLIWKRITEEEYRRGDIVAFWAPHDPEKQAIKRIIAVEGDSVYPKDRHAQSPKYPFKRVVVPMGHVWVEGDNWRMSHDSNDYGPISKKLLVGKATQVVWPWRKLEIEGFKPRSTVVQGDPSMAPRTPFNGESIPDEYH